MKLLPASILLIFGAGMAHAKSPVAYGLIDKVTIQPKADGVQTAQVWGVFALFDEATKSFHDPRRGYFYFELPASAADVCKQLLAAAGSAKVVGLLGRLGDPQFSTVHGPNESLPPHGIALKEVFLTFPGTDFAPVRALLEFR